LLKTILQLDSTSQHRCLHPKPLEITQTQLKVYFIMYSSIALMFEALFNNLTPLKKVLKIAEITQDNNKSNVKVS